MLIFRDSILTKCSLPAQEMIDPDLNCSVIMVLEAAVIDNLIMEQLDNLIIFLIFQHSETRSV